jgi:hypothetical protein
MNMFFLWEGCLTVMLRNGLSTMCAHYMSCFLSCFVSYGESKTGGTSENEDYLQNLSYIFLKINYVFIKHTACNPLHPQDTPYTSFLHHGIELGLYGVNFQYSSIGYVVIHMSIQMRPSNNSQVRIMLTIIN